MFFMFQTLVRIDFEEENKNFTLIMRIHLILKSKPLIRLFLFLNRRH